MTYDDKLIVAFVWGIAGPFLIVAVWHYVALLYARMVDR